MGWLFCKFTFFPVHVDYLFILANSYMDVSVINPKACCRKSDRISFRDSELYRIFSGSYKNFQQFISLSCLISHLKYFLVFPKLSSRISDRLIFRNYNFSRILEILSSFSTCSAFLFFLPIIVIQKDIKYSVTKWELKELLKVLYLLQFC